MHRLGTTAGVARRLTGRTVLVVGVGAVLLTGCAGSDPEPVTAPAASAPAVSPPAVNAPPAGTPTEGAPTQGAASGSAPGAGSGPAEVPGEEDGALEPDVGVTEVEVSLVGGAVSPPPGRVEVVRGDRVRLVVTSDAADEVHVHGYDLEGPVGPGEPFVVEFVADADGQYEVETHDTGLLLFQLLVR